MVQIFHLVGKLGCGKSTHALMLSKYFEAQGKKCAGVDDPMSEFIKSRYKAIEHWTDADVIFIEHYPGEVFTTAPYDTVITLEKIPG